MTFHESAKCRTVWQRFSSIENNTRKKITENVHWMFPFSWDASSYSLVDVYLGSTWWGQKSHFFLDNGISKPRRNADVFRSNRIKSTSNSQPNFSYLLPLERPKSHVAKQAFGNQQPQLHSGIEATIKIFASNHRITTRYSVFINTQIKFMNSKDVKRTNPEI